jgi:hypothetical protein
MSNLDNQYPYLMAVTLALTEKAMERPEEETDDGERVRNYNEDEFDR